MDIFIGILINLFVMAVGYLFGSISSSIILAKIVHHDDIRKYGSGNAGATNTTRAFGFKEGFIVFLLDISKVLLPIIIIFFLKYFKVIPFYQSIHLPLVGFMAFIGHIWPVFHKFKGGKGVSCFFGFILSINIVLAIIFVIICLIVVYRWKMVSLVSVTCPSAIFCISWVPWLQTGILSFFYRHEIWWLSSFLLIVMAAIIVYKHIPNIKRIIENNESTIAKILSK